MAVQTPSRPTGDVPTRDQIAIEDTWDLTTLYLSDADWEQARKDVAAQGYEALGQIAMVRKKYDVAAQNWKTAMDTAANPDPATMVRLASAYNQLGKPDEAIAVLDKLNTMTEVHPQIKSAATEQRNNAVKIKAGGAKPAPANAPPAQVPIK